MCHGNQQGAEGHAENGSSEAPNARPPTTGYQSTWPTTVDPAAYAAAMEHWKFAEFEGLHLTSVYKDAESSATASSLQAGKRMQRLHRYPFLINRVIFHSGTVYVKLFGCVPE
jgi:hypothetical protein